jgi:tRNA(Ile)-lysidine synthase
MFVDFLKYIEENKICRKGDRILLAVSGGIDSMVMTHLFLSAGFESGIAHCNFSLRGAESDKDEELVEKISSEYKIPFYSVKFETKNYAKKNRISVQMAARELRYHWFETIRSANNYDFIAIAHNLNDNIETFLINLIRGTGITGLTGMRSVSHRIIRPLIFATRDMIKEYRDLNDIPFREDKSNADTKYTRNKIRHVVLPVLKQINPALESTLNETADRLAETNKIVTDLLQKINEQSSYYDGKILKYKINSLQPHLENKTLTFELFKPFGITGSTVRDLLKVLEGRTGGKIITSTHRLIKNRNELFVSVINDTDQIYCEINNTENLRTAPGIESADIMKITPGFKVKGDKKSAFIDFKKVSFPMIIRRWKKGDFFIPFGMKDKKKLSDYFIDKKYSLFEKEEALILESAGNIVWIIGERTDDRFKITPSTTEVLIIKAS